MANIDAAFGLRPYRMLGSGANTNGDVVYNIQTAATAGTSSVIYQGSPVIPLANGMIDIVGAASGGTVPLLGAFLGCNYIDLTGKPRWSPYWPGTASVMANSVATATISAHPDQAFLTLSWQFQRQTRPTLSTSAFWASRILLRTPMQRLLGVWPLFCLTITSTVTMPMALARVFKE